MNTLDQEIVEARKKMAEKFANVKLGGKGRLSPLIVKVHRKERLNPNTEQMQSLLIRKFSH